MGEALKEAYGDLFTIKERPVEADRQLIEGKFRSAHNATPITAKLMASTFYALLGLADLAAANQPPLQHSNSFACYKRCGSLQRNFQVPERPFA